MTQRVFNGEKWRVITPIFLTVITAGMTAGLWVLSAIRGDIVLMREDVKDVAARLYQHQTNHDLHTPRTEIVEMRRDLLEARKEAQADVDRIIGLLERASK